jgi:hypothetical protein
MDDLVRRLREYADYRATADDLSRCLFSAADRIEKLEYFLKVRDDFLDKHYLWQELVISLGEKK